MADEIYFENARISNIMVYFKGNTR